MQRKAYSHKFFTTKSKLRPLEPPRRPKKLTSKCSQSYRKIPKVLNDLEKNIQQLKKYFEQEENYQIGLKKDHNPSSKSRSLRPKSSTSKKTQKPADDESTVVAELEDVKRSFLTMNGYDSNNVVELYNFYKKNMEKSTRIFGSISGVNSTQNYSDLRDNRKPANSLLQPTCSLIQNEESECIPSKKRSEQMAFNIIKRNNQLVNVANLLADRKKISRQNICSNMNSDSLFNQAKRRLVRPNTMENIERNKISNKQGRKVQKQNKRSENIRISPARRDSASRPKTPISDIKSHQKSSTKKQEKQIINPTNNIPIHTISSHVESVAFKSPKPTKLFSPIIKDSSSGNKQSKQQRDHRSSKSIKSSKSIRSPSLNRGQIFECEQFDNQRTPMQNEAFKKSKTQDLNESLLDCEISMRENSRVVDLESVSFEF